MKYLGIDYGEKRVGIAATDANGTVAFPKTVIENGPDLVKKISDLAAAEKTEVIVVGESKDYQGADNKISPAIISFKRELGNAITLPIFLEPEFMSSMQVEKTFGKTGMLDASAAAIVLQTFLDKEKSRQEKKKKDEAANGRGKISIDDFAKVEMKVGRILSAEPIAGSDKLVKLSVDFAERSPRQILSGIAKFFPDANALVGKHVVFVTNLEPRTMMGLESNGMILAAHADEALALVEMPDVAPGTKLG
ncbi:MAG: methionine--tRNA ligase subunit beta [Patescibacteria group bacterium]|nr:methionine--tRNA ligase subunit beta [Patescibacteria group bacterium]MDE1945696.1 methionine--tRNA ligase subunit beta [Patescibacteria group bacterium]